MATICAPSTVSSSISYSDYKLLIKHSLIAFNNFIFTFRKRNRRLICSPVVAAVVDASASRLLRSRSTFYVPLPLISPPSLSNTFPRTSCTPRTSRRRRQTILPLSVDFLTRLLRHSVASSTTILLLTIEFCFVCYFVSVRVPLSCCWYVVRVLRSNSRRPFCFLRI